MRKDYKMFQALSIYMKLLIVNRWLTTQDSLSNFSLNKRRKPKPFCGRRTEYTGLASQTSFYVTARHSLFEIRVKNRSAIV